MSRPAVWWSKEPIRTLAQRHTTPLIRIKQYVLTISILNGIMQLAKRRLPMVQSSASSLPEPAIQIPAPTDRQKQYILRTGKRFALGNVETGDVSVNVSIIDVHVDWLEFHYEDSSGQPQGTARSIQLDRFRVSIVSELEELDTKECERRGYR